MKELLDQNYRVKIIREIKSDENIQRKVSSYKKQNMQEDNFYQYVKEYLESKLDALTVKELSIFSNINLQRRVSKSEASLYKNPPSRTVSVNGSEIPEFEEMYSKMSINTLLRRANEAYKYQGQCAIQVYPSKNKLMTRVLLPHHFDVIPDELNPEEPAAYIISNFDNTDRDRLRKENGRTGASQGDKYKDGVNQAISDYDDQQSRKERYYVWSKTHNFVMNGKGEILDKETESKVLEIIEEDSSEIISPVAEYDCLPFIDVSTGKNFEFWVRGYDSLFEATIIYNVILTSEFQTVEMQGHAQPYYKGDAEHMPENIRIGVDKLIFIPINPQNPVQAEFGFANPGSDLAGIREFRESFLAAFLTSRGLDTSIVSGNPQTTTASSGVEKLLQMVEKYEASQEDISLFNTVEESLLKIISCFVNSFKSERINGELLLEESFQIALPDDVSELSLNLQYSKPEMIKTEMELLDIAQKELEMGLMSKVHILMNLKNMTEEEAVKHLQKVEQFEGLNGGNQRTEILEEGSITEV
jgi:hypothetical protein